MYRFFLLRIIHNSLFLKRVQGQNTKSAVYFYLWNKLLFGTVKLTVLFFYVVIGKMVVFLSTGKKTAIYYSRLIAVDHDY